MWKHKKIAPLILFFEGQMYLDLLVFIFMLQVLLKQYLMGKEKKTLVTKDIVTLTLHILNILSGA